MNSIPGTCDCHTHPDPGACSQQLNSHIFQTDGSRSSTSDIAFYFIYHISSIHLMLTIAGLYGLNIAQHFLECRRYSFLITQDNCSNISLPAWFHMAHHRIQSNKCVCVRAVQRNSQKVLWKQNQTEQLQRQNCIMFHVQKNYCSFYCLVNRAEVWLCGCNIF